MLSFPNCKINLGLHITGKRADGYHNLETVFYPLPFYEALEIIAADSLTETSFTTTGLAIAGDSASNLCLKAYHLLQNDFPHVPAVQIHLHKAIPMGAGLGGGSADGAFTLTMLDRLFQTGLTKEQLIQYALQLGSDCPFFLLNTPCFATGRGEKMQPLTLDLNPYKIILVNPGIHVSTAYAFANITPAPPKHSLRDIVQQPVTTWKDVLVNDFEAPVFALHPAIRDIKEQLYAAGALYAAMTGTGSTVFGIFEKTAVPGIAFPDNYFVKHLG